MTPRKARLTRMDFPHPRLHTILKPDSESIPFRYEDDSKASDLTCVECEEVLVTKTQRYNVPRLVIRCPSCGTYNDTA